MNILMLPLLHIYEPSLVEGPDKLFDIDGDAKKNYFANKHDYLDDEVFHSFPLLLEADGTLWEHGCRFLLSRIDGYDRQTVVKNARYLLYFIQYCRTNEINYLEAPRRLSRPTIMYRKYLLTQEYSRVTKKNRMCLVIRFYRWLIEHEHYKFKHELWEERVVHHIYKNNQGIQKYKSVNEIDMCKFPVKKNTRSAFANVIIDGGKLSPLNKSEQVIVAKMLLLSGNIEMLYASWIAVATSGRIQSVFTLRECNFLYEVSDSESQVLIPIGEQTFIDTKYGKSHVLHFPKKLYKRIQMYIKSERYIKRKEKFQAVYPKSEVYLFLTMQGNSYYTAKDDIKLYPFASIRDGSTVRQFFTKTLSSLLIKNGHDIALSFHDLRATAGMNMLEKSLRSKKAETALIDVKDFLGHNNISTSERYLRYRDNVDNKEISESQKDFESYIYDMLERN